jgi:hypothetical protein
MSVTDELPLPSWPGLTRPSTRRRWNAETGSLDARVKPAHDAESRESRCSTLGVCVLCFGIRGFENG